MTPAIWPLEQWVTIEWFNDHTEAWCCCQHCGCTTTAAGVPEAVAGVVDRFSRVHGECAEKKGD